MSPLRIATRRSALALVQARRVAEFAKSVTGITDIELVEVETTGDRDRSSPITHLTEVGAFVRAIQQAVLDGMADLAVHSLKDLPVAQNGSPLVAFFPERSSPHDVIVGTPLQDLGPADAVGTGSPRREAQLLEIRPDLRVVPIRGNVDTRLRKVADGDPPAAVLAEAGLERLGRLTAVTQRLSVDEMVPAPGQGVLAVEAMRGTPGEEVAAAIDEPRLRPLVSAERLLLTETGAGCRSALGALATWDGDRINLDSFVADERGSRRSVAAGESPAEVVAGARKELGL